MTAAQNPDPELAPFKLGVDHRRLTAVRHLLDVGLRGSAGQCGPVGCGTLGPDAYVIDDTGFPKDGKASPLVARMYSGTLSKTANCQIGASVQMVTGAASLAANWRLYCQASWDDAAVGDPDQSEQIRGRRVRAGVPDEVLAGGRFVPREGVRPCPRRHVCSRH